MDTLILVSKIYQKDDYRFTIEWTDGKISEYRLSAVQRLCPCAQCRDEKTGSCMVDPACIDENVQARQIVSVGRYALRIDFTSGCAKGIYRFSFLYTL